MSHDGFLHQCDVLSDAVDPVSFERLRWDRDEGPKLARLVALAHGVLEPRSDFEMVEEGATADVKRFTLKVHSNRIISLALALDQGRASVNAGLAERSKYKLSSMTPIIADFDTVDEAWMETALEELFARITT